MRPTGQASLAANHVRMTTVASEPFRLSVCICTRNRPDDLVRAIRSVASAGANVHQIVVSDDSTSGATRDLVTNRFPNVTFVEGPRTGLCANRNEALRNVTGTHVLFIDDDATLGARFVPVMRATYAAAVDPEALIATGLEQNSLHGLVYPKGLDFFGYQKRVYRPGDTMKSIVINAAVFPRALFTNVRFDENLIYGLDEVDLATRAVARGFHIELVVAAVNEHYPSPVNRDYNNRHLEASRLYVTFRRHLVTDRNAGKAALFAVLAPLKLLASRLRKAPAKAVPETFDTVATALSYLTNARARRPRPGAAAGRPA